MRKPVLFMFMAFLAVGMVGCGSASKESSSGGGEEGQPAKIRIGIGYATEEPLWLMEAAPELAKNNGKKYELEFQQFRANADRLNAYRAGQLEGGTLGQGALIMAADQGVDLEVVASVAKDTPNKGFNFPFMAKKDSGIKSVKDLKGKTIGIPDFKSPTDMWARTALRNAGLDPDKDVKFSVLPTPAVEESIKSGKIDVGLIPQPFYAEVESKGELKTVFTSKDGVPIDEDFLSLFFNPEFIKEHEEAFKAFIEDYQTTMKYYLENEQDARQKLLDKEFVLAEKEVYLNMEDSNRAEDISLNRESWEQVQEIMLQEKWITKEVDLDALLNETYVK
ncbi:MAG TPA: ABC transporter substrate-binding protein [Bacillus bacterium]|uniref:ABC transporter substrate-binding protein n=1 Tax=Siminovitchia fordii TaxID=254759 RepID=UPI000369574C|nr:ABC transporter substrate-binding protein [Siminovitchia fordii]HBZ08339.1 ABC transporter substrate-binding protein [Bacillus sp. (in: firmicutes)]